VLAAAPAALFRRRRVLAASREPPPPICKGKGGDQKRGEALAREGRRRARGRKREVTGEARG